MGNTNHLLESDSDRSDSRDVVDKEDEVHAREDNLPCMSEQQIQDDSNDKDTIEHDEKGREILVIDGKCFVSVAAPRVMLEDLREEQVFKIWKSYFSRTMSGEMRRIRVAAGSRSVPPPAWMRQDLWEGLWDIWETRKYKILQNQNRRNRLSDRDGLGVVKSTAGTISISHHAHRLALKNGGKSVSFQEVFDRTHRRNKGKGLFVDQKSKKISKYGLASGGPRNGRCYGFGNSYSGQHAPGQCINPGRFSHFSAPPPSYFQPLVPPSYFPPPASISDGERGAPLMEYKRRPLMVNLLMEMMEMLLSFTRQKRGLSCGIQTKITDGKLTDDGDAAQVLLVPEEYYGKVVTHFLKELFSVWNS
ncbi:UNVERIFIED_CONTAM: hypothetical protein Sradi_3233500 [Sesamum radiatum]|uniref:Uncharacterized protein n=1 Tax=Sesamum radiatum TaxID=300843 RepID=A0AAW2RGC6_SESRA